LVAQLLHSKNLVWGGILIFLLTGLGAAASAVLAKRDPSAVMLGGCLALSVGALVTLASIQTGTSVTLFIGTMVAGLGLGPAFMGAYRSTIALAPADDRVGLIAAIYLCQLSGNPHPDGDRRHRHVALRAAQHRTRLPGGRRRAGRGGGQPADAPPDGDGNSDSPRRSSRRASRPRHRATMSVCQAATRRRESMSGQLEEVARPKVGD
jgi:hypothetical protein